VLTDELLAVIGDTRTLASGPWCRPSPRRICAMSSDHRGADPPDVRERDERSARAFADQLHTSIPGTRLAFIPGVGPVCNIEAPDLFDAEVRQFLRAARS